MEMSAHLRREVTDSAGGGEWAVKKGRVLK